MNGLTFRPATPWDYPELCGLVTDTYATILPAGYLVETRATLEHRAARASIWVAEYDGRVIATATLAAGKTYYGPAANKGQVEVNRLAVDVRYQRLGIGERFIKAILNAGKSTPHAGVVFITTDAMPAARAMFEKLGAARLRKEDQLGIIPQLKDKVMGMGIILYGLDLPDVAPRPVGSLPHHNPKEQ